MTENPESTTTEDGPASDSSVAPAAEAAPVEASAEPSASSAHPHDLPADADAPEGEASEAPEGEASAEASSEAGDEEGKKRKRRRRRRKKKGEGGETAEGAPSEEAPARPRRENAPALHSYFTTGTRRHAFSIGEVVAGRVIRVGENLGVVDLFGKATAYMRLCEPRDVPLTSATTDNLEDTSAGSISTPHAAMRATVEAPPAEAEPEASTVEAPAEASTVEAPAEASTVEAPAEASTVEAPAEASAPEASAPEASANADGDDDADDLEPHPEADPDEEPVEELPPPGYVLSPEGVEPVAVGQIFRGRVGSVSESGHIALVNEIVDKKLVRNALVKARKERTRVTGLIFGFNRGGFDVLIYGLRAFCPVGGASLELVEDPNLLLGEWSEFHVQTAKSGNQGLVVSRRSILEKEARKRGRALLKSLEAGRTVKGRVTQVRDYGLFIDIGGVEGLAHQSELSWDRTVKPSDVAKVGDEVEVQILKVHERESKRERFDRVSLSMKALAPDPWNEHKELLTEGRALKGTVVRTAEFGAFIQVAPSIDGLLHVSELGKSLVHANQAVKEGDEVYVVVERVDERARRVSLSKLSDHEAELFAKGELDTAKRAPKLKQGGNVRVVVTQVMAAGLQVRVDDVVGKRGRGFIPNAEMGTAKGTDHRKKWPPGTELDVLIIGTDRDGGLRLSRKRFLQDEERRAVREYKKEASKQGFGTFGDLLRQKLES